MPKTKLEKNKEAESRAKERYKISHKDQIAKLDSLFGPGLGATKERARLLNLIESSNKPEEKATKKKSKKKDQGVTKSSD